MTSRMRCAPLAACAAIAASCAGAPGAPSRGATSPAAPLVTEHFSFSYSASQSLSSVEALAAAVEREHARVSADLGVPAMPRVTVTFHSDHAALAAAVAPVAGAIPWWATGLATAADQMHVMAGISATNVVHEFAHCVSMRINPRIPNNPRWLWEAVAVYEAGQAVNPRTLPYMVAGAPPAFATLNGFDNTLVYDVGYTIAEFVVVSRGIQSLAQLVGNNGDVESTFGLTLPGFERAWQAFVRSRYGV